MTGKTAEHKSHTSEKLSRKERRALKKKDKSPEQKDTKKASVGIKRIYEENYKKLLIIPFGLFILSLIVIGLHYANTGEFVKRGISLKGGVELTLTHDMTNIDAIDLDGLRSYLKDNFKGYDIKVRETTDFGKRTGITIEAGFEDKGKIDELGKLISDRYNIDEDKLFDNLSTIGSSLSEDFFKTGIIAIITAFIFMAIVVFISFKTLAPSSAVVLAAFSDIVVTLGIIDLFNIELSTAGIAAFLMLIGYSVDTDILLSTRVLKRKDGTVMDRVYNAMKTGLGMTLTTLGAVSVGLIFSTSQELRQIFLIILIGLLVDIVNTWIQNVGILRYYLEKKGGDVL